MIIQIFLVLFFFIKLSSYEYVIVPSNNQNWWIIMVDYIGGLCWWNMLVDYIGG